MEDKNQNTSTVSLPDGSGVVEPPFSNAALATSDAGALSQEPGLVSSSDEFAQIQSPHKKFSRALLRANIAIVVVLLGVLAGVMVVANRDKSGRAVTSNVGNEYVTQQIPLAGFISSAQGLSFAPSNVVVNGTLKVSDGLVIAPSVQPSAPTAGEMYFDRNTNQLAYFNGAAFVPLTGNTAVVQSIGGASGTLTLGGGLRVVGDQLRVDFPAQAAFPAHVTSVGGQTGEVTVGNGLRMLGNSLQNAGVVGVNAGSGIAVTDNGDGTVTVANVGAGSGTVASSGGTNGTFPLFTGAQNIENSILTQSGGTVTVNGDLTVTGGVTTLGNPLAVSNGGIGVASLAANGVVVANGTAPLSSVTAGSPGLCLLSTGGAPAFGACPSGSGVSSLNSQTGALTLANASAAAGTITIDNASTVTKGIASFSSTNFSVAGGAVNTIQNIGSTATPTFAGVNTNAITPSSSLTIGSVVQNFTVQGSSASVFTVTGGGQTTTVGFSGVPTGAVRYNFDRAAAVGTYTVCSTAGNCTAAGGAGGDLTGSYPNPTIARLQGTNLTIAGPAAGHILVYNATNNQWENRGISGDVAISETGTAAIQPNAVTLGSDTTGTYVLGLTPGNGVSVTGSAGEGWSPTLSVDYGSSANTAVQGNTNITLTAGTNLTGGGSITLGAGGTLSLNVANSPTFSGTLTVQGASTTIGGAAQQGSVVLFDGSSNTGAIQTASLGQNTTFTLPDPGAGSATICLSTGNCAGAGSGMTTSGGTTNRVGKFTGSQALGDSSISDDGTTVTINGSVNLVVQGGTSTLGTLGQAGALSISDGSSNTVTIVAAGVSADRTYTLPEVGGNATFCMSTGNCIGAPNGSAPFAAEYLVTSLDGTLSNERALNAGANISFTDGGANGNFTVATVQNPTFATSVTTPALQSSGALTISSAAGEVLAIDAGTTIELQDSTNVTGSLDVSAGFSAGTSNAFIVSSAGAITAATGITSSGTVTFSTLDCTVNANGGALTTNGSGQLVCSDDNDGGASAIGGSGTSGTLAMFNGAQTITNSIITQSGGVITIAGSLALNTALTVANGGTGSTAFTSNGVLYGNGSGALQVTAAGTSGQVLVANGSGVPAFVAFSGDVAVSATGTATIQPDSVALGTDTTGNYVATFGSLTGLTTTGNSGEGSTPTLSVTYGSSANTAAEGNTGITVNAGTNLTGGGGVTLGAGGAVTLHVADSPTFSGTVTVQGATASIGTASQQGGLVLHDGSSNTGTLQTAALGQNTTFTLPDPAGASATICLSTGNCAGAGGGVTTGGGTTNRISKFSAAQALADSSISDNGTAVTINGSVNLVVQGGTGTFGTTTQAGTLAISDGSSNTLSIVATGFAADRTYTLPDAGSDAAFCLSSGNCIGSGGGGAPSDATYLVASLSGNLSNERSLNAGSNISFTDGGANGNFTVATVQNPAFTTSVTTPILQSSGALTISSAAGEVLAIDAGTTIELQDSTNVTGSIDISAGLTAGTSNAFQVSSAGAITSATGIASSGTVTFSSLNCTANANGGALTTNGSGQLMCSDDDGGAGGITGSGTNGTLAMFSGASTITNSIISQSAGVVTLAGSLSLNTALSVSNGGTGATTFTSNGLLYGNGTNALQVTAAGTIGQVLVANASGTPAFVTFSGDVTVSATGVMAIQPNAVTLGSDTTGDYIANLGTLTGLSISGNTGEGSTPTLSVDYGSSANTAVQGNTNITLTAGTNLTGGGSITLGAGGTLSLNVANSPTFSGTLTVQGATATIGTTSLQGSMVLHDGSSNTGTLQTSALGQDTTYTLPDPSAASATICLSTGNCAGAGNGVTTAGGTSGTLAVFTGAQALGDSLVSQSGGTVTVNGNLNVATGNQFQLNGAQISSAVLSNDANLAKLGSSQTFTGNTVALQNGTNSTNAFNIQNQGGVRLLTADTDNGQILLGQASTLDGRLVFSNVSNANTVTILPGTPGADRTLTLPDASGVICTDSGNCAGAGATLQTAYNFSTGGTTPKIKVNGALLGVDIQDADTTIGANLFNVRASNGSGLGSVMLGVGSTGQVTLQNASNSASAFRILTQGGTAVMGVDTDAGRVVLGQGGTLAGALQFSNATNANVITLNGATAGAVRTITLPDADGTICLQNAASCGFALASGGTNYIQNQSATPQTANFNITSGAAANVPTARITQVDNSTGNGYGLLVVGGSNPGAHVFEVQNSSSNQIFAVDTSSSRVMVGSSCTSGRLCVGQSTSGTGSSTVTNLYNQQSINMSGGTGTFISQNIIMTDTSAAIGTTLKPLVIDTSTSTNSAVTISSIYAKIPANAAGTFLQFQNGTTDIVNISNAGAASFTSTGTADAHTITQTNTSGIQTNGLLFNRNGAGGTTTNGIAITNSAGTLANGLAFAGTIGTDIQRANGTLTMQGGGGVTMSTAAAASTGAIAIQTGNASAGNSGNVTITSGDATGGNSGDVTIDVGAATGTKGTIIVGSTNTGTVDIGRSASTINFGTGGSALSAVVVQLAPDTNSGIFMQNAATDSTHIQYALSKRANNLDFSHYAYDGTTFWSYFRATWANKGITLNDHASSVTNIGATGTSGNSTAINIGSSSSADVDILLGSANSASTLILEAGTGATALQIGNGATAHGIQIGTNSSAAQTVSMGSTHASSVTAINGGNGITLTTNAAASGVTVQSNTNSSAAFKVQNASSGSLFNVDSANANISLLGLNTGDVQAWVADTGDPLPATRYGGTAVAANGYLYNVGGHNNANVPQNTVTYHKINADGSVSYVGTTTSLPDERGRHGSFAANGYLYVIGGRNDVPTTQTTVYFAKIYTDGTLGAWEQTTGLPDERRDAYVAYNNGYAYAIGGFDSTGTAQTTVYYSRVNADGSLDAWSTDTDIVPDAGRAQGGIAIANGRIYIIGGFDGAVASGDVFYASINGNGSIGSWTSLLSSLPSARVEQSTVVVNGYVYAIGGNNGGYQSTVYYAKINASGSLGSWTEDTNSPLPGARGSAHAVTNNGYIYVMGGYDGTHNATVFYASTSRVTIGGSLDLVSTQSGSLSDAGGDGSTGSTGGALTAGNGTFIGSLQVKGQTSLNSALNVGGPATFQSSSDSFSAFAVLNASTVPLFRIDTTASRVYIGGPIADATAALLVLDNHPTDPSGVAGAMYYNSTDGKFRCYEGSAWKNCVGDGPQLVTFTSSGTFTKANYSWATRIKVRLVGGGGAGGGAQATAAGEGSMGGGGGGGTYSERIISISSLGANETVTVGVGGTSVSGGTGNTGGTSSFGAWVSADGGEGGTSRSPGTVAHGTAGGNGGNTGSGGDVLFSGDSGGTGWGDGQLGVSGHGGASHLGGGALGRRVGAAGNRLVGNGGLLYGGGGSGGLNSGGVTAVGGGAGAPGIVIVELY